MSNFENYKNVEKMRVVEKIKKCINPKSDLSHLHHVFDVCKLNFLQHFISISYRI